MKASSPDRLNRRIGTDGGPFADNLEEFLASLRVQHYAQSRISPYKRVSNTLGHVVKDAGIEVGDLDENSAVDLVRRSTHLVSWKRRFEFIIRKFFRYLGDVGVARPVSPPALDDGRVRQAGVDCWCR